MTTSRLFLSLAIFFPAGLLAELPDGPGKEQTIRLCAHCHEVERALSIRQNREGWQQTVNKMLALGLEAKDEDIRATVDYLATNFPADAVPKVNINTATAVELEATLSLRRSQAASIIEYRTKKGKFKSIDDLKKVPGIEAAKIDAKKERLTF